MAGPHDLIRLRAQRDAALASAIASEDRAGAIEGAIANAARAGRRDEAARLEEERKRLQRAAQTARNDYTRLEEEAIGGFVAWLERSPEDIVSGCADAFPFVLFPIRLETKFFRSGGSTELRVRFFPDDIAVSPPLAAPSDVERALAIEYWRARAHARHTEGNEAQAAYRGAWAALVHHVGPHRAGYLVRAVAPSNPGASSTDLIFPAASLDGALPIARAQGLPDRFVVLLYRRDPTTKALNQVGRAVGAPIPDTLVLAPNADQPESWLTRDETTGRIVVPDALRWLVNFETAKAMGMALSVPIPPPFDQIGYDRVIAIGVRGVTPPEDGPALLNEIFSRHRYADGCSIVTAGTPTNNSESAASGWHADLGDADELFAIEDQPPDIGPKGGLLGTSDGWRLSQLLGLDPELVRRFPNAARTDIAEALAMNRALVPGTLDDFVSEFLKDTVSPQVAADLHRFFISWVSGRGLYPALRVGRQPYGIVVASAWNRWETRDHTPIADGNLAPAILDLLGKHRFRWQLLGQRAPHAALRGIDPFERLIAIVGLLASSTTFVSRKAVSDKYIRERLRFGGATDAATTGWFKELQSARTANLTAVNFPTAPGPTDPLLAFIVFLRDTSDWRPPLIDRDPKVPLSETNPVASYDGTRNYLGWLTQASRADITGERFTGPDGTPIAAPSALLYVLLRHAVLAALESASLEAATVHGSQFFDVITRDALIANIGSEQHIQRRDYLEVDASRLGLANTQTPLADWVLAGGRLPRGERPSAAERLAEVQEAIAALTGLPTARLERLMAEHVDLCSYRIDAWITALYSQRLELLLARSTTPGLHVGAFGWIENLRPATGRTSLSIDALPPELRGGVAGRVFEDSSNGGYVHAPSLAQATTAAVLRNGYLSHAAPDQPLPFSVNLSSARMRAAVALTTGVRAGQPIAALLGYQFERGLHEDHPGVELDQFIAILRDRFPLVSNRVTEVPPGTGTQLVEARNVVDGLALADTTRNATYPYGIANLPAVGSAAAAAIATEVDRIQDALDATSDLLMAESVHQAVQGNLSRTLAAQQAMTSPAVPPEADIIETPRSGRVLSFRVTIAFDVERIDGWNDALTPRATANPQLNHWLSDSLPPPGDIGWSVRVGESDPVHQSMNGLKLEPLDLVLMSGERLGDQSSELERYLIRMFRWQHPTDERLSFDFTDFPSGTSLAMLHPLVTRFRRLITAARAAHAADWRRAADGRHAAPGDPTGSAGGHARLENFTDLRERLETASQSLRLHQSELVVALADIEPLQTALGADPISIGNPAWIGALERVRRVLFALTLFGIPEAVPVDGDGVSAIIIDRLTTQARNVVTLTDDRLARTQELLTVLSSDPLPAGEVERLAEMTRRNSIQRDRYLEAGKTLLGPAFGIIPLFQFAADQRSEVTASIDAPAASAAAAEEWLLSLARVRPRMADLAWVLAASRWIEHPIADATAVQFPCRTTAPWIAGTFSEGLPPGEWLSLLVVDSAATHGSLQAGLLVDDWTETVPNDRETTGVAFNFDRPNAVAPQALLVAVPPVLRGNWAWDDLVGSVHEALDLTTIRAVEPDALLTRDENTPSPAGDYFQVLPAILAEFTAGRVATTDFAARVATVLTQLSP